MKPQSPFAPPTIGEHARAPLTPPPTTPTAGVSWWRRFRNLPLLGQIGIWIGIAFVGLVALALAVGPTTKKDASPASSATPAPTTTAVADATTTTLQSREAAIGAGNVARCRNGGYSNNTDFSSTCSSSGDVKEWLAPYGECQDGTVIKMSADASCDNHGGFKILMPVDFTPPTTTVAATIPTTVPPTAPPTAPPPTLPNFGGGTKLVGIDIQPGTYVTSSIDGFSCYWERLSDVSGDFSAIIANSNLLPGAQGLVEIKPSDVAFKSSGCGTWVAYLPPPAAATSFGEGVWIVNQQLVPGRYRSDTINSFGCYWARLRGVSGELAEIIANDNVPQGTAIVQIKPSDGAFESSGCGSWTQVG